MIPSPLFRRCALAASVLVSLAALSGCVTPPVAEPAVEPAIQTSGINSRPELRQVPLTGVISFAYTISGDPGAMPTQVFDDGRFLFMQFRPDEPPPIPHTPEGRLLEFEVMQGGLVRTVKQPSVVLRLGPRTAFVQHQTLEIVGLTGLALERPQGAAVQPRITVEPAPGFGAAAASAGAAAQAEQPLLPMTLDLATAVRDVRRLPAEMIRGQSFEVCHGPSIADKRRALAIVRHLRDNGAQSVEITDVCQDRGRATIRSI